MIIDSPDGHDDPDCSCEPNDPDDYYNPDDYDDHDYCDDHDDSDSLCWQIKMQNHPYPVSHTVIKGSATYVYSVTYWVGVVLHIGNQKCMLPNENAEPPLPGNS